DCNRRKQIYPRRTATRLLLCYTLFSVCYIFVKDCLIIRYSQIWNFLFRIFWPLLTRLKHRLSRKFQSMKGKFRTLCNRSGFGQGLEHTNGARIFWCCTTIGRLEEFPFIAAEQSKNPGPPLNDRNQKIRRITGWSY